MKFHWYKIMKRELKKDNMIINDKILSSAGAEIKEYSQGEFIFHEGASPLYYYQITKGKVKLNNSNEDGKEFIQNILSEGQSIGDSLLFLERSYPMDAIALTECTVLRLCKNNFFSMLRLYPHLYLNVCKAMSGSLYYQYIMMQKNSSLHPAERLMEIMVYLKSFQKEKEPFSFKIPFTRQQLANLTGICVETAIRTIKFMERENIVKIKNRKIFF